MSSTSVWKKRFVTAGLAMTVLVALPSAANAATNFGSRLNHDPANSGECDGLLTPCTMMSFIHPSDPNGDPYSGGAPVDGVITKWRTRIEGLGGSATVVTLRLGNISRPDPNNADIAVATDAGTGPTVTIPANAGLETPIIEHAARLPVKKGNQLGLDTTNGLITYNNSGDKFSYRFDPPLVAGQGPRGSNEAKGELLVAATIEPDADNDGFGDETQDKCPNQNGGADGCDTVIPTLAMTGGKSLKVRKLEVTVTANEASNVQVSGAVKLGKARKKRAKKSAKAIKPKTVTQTVAANSATKVKLKLSKKNARKVLRRLKRKGRASIKITAVATDLAGNKSSVQTKTFKLKR
jgi:hypothetical protein